MSWDMSEIFLLAIVKKTKIRQKGILLQNSIGCKIQLLCRLQRLVETLCVPRHKQPTLPQISDCQQDHDRRLTRIQHSQVSLIARLVDEIINRRSDR